MGRDPAPSLLIAVYRLYRGPEQLGHLLLGFVQDFTKRCEFFTVHTGFKNPSREE